MSSSDASLTEAQWDLLADYLGGALDDDPRRDEVAALIESDPGWREAHAALAEASDAVRADLRALAESPVGPMPDDVAARLDAALPGTVVVPFRKRRVPRWALPATIAAGVLAFAAFGLSGLIDDRSSSDSATSAAGGAPEAAALPMLAQQVLVSGRDYTAASAETLARQVRTRGGAAVEEFASPLAASDAEAPAAAPGRSAAPALARLTDPVALRACLQAISLENGAATAVVRLVDYASFQGSPGLLVLLTDADGRDVVWVAGPECGAAGMGADTRYRTPVG